MPLNYLEGNPQDAYAIQRMGSTFSDALIGMQQQRIRQQAVMAQQQLDQAYYRLAAQKAMQDSGVTAEDIKRLQAETSLLGSQKKVADANVEKINTDTANTKEQQMAGQDLGFDIKQLNEATDPQVQQFIRGLIAQQSAKIAATSPQNIAKQGIILQQGLDPRVANLIATDTPAVMNVSRGGTLYDTQQRRPLFESQVGVNLQDPANARLRALSAVYNALNRPNFDINDQGGGQGEQTKNDVLGAINDNLGQIGARRSGGGGDGQGTASSGASQRFASEQAARAGGKKAGDRVYLQGVGLVELQ